MAQSNGISISRELEVLGNIGKHFNSPDMSDVTLTVGEQSYQVHRFVLSAQSSVFHTMLMNGQWKEATDKVIKLEESPECEPVFGDFLKFFYTGKLTLNQDNVCAFHMIADKYDVSVLKQDAVTFMKEVLTGVERESYPSALIWLLYIEQFIPDILPICYESLQTNFREYAYSSIKRKTCQKLEVHHLKQILTRMSSNVVAHSECIILDFVWKWAKLKYNDLSGKAAKANLKEILQLIRFHNMNVDDLMQLEESELSKAIGNSFITDYISPAYRVHAQMTTILRKDVMSACPWDSDDNCPHMNPQFYTKRPYGMSGYFSKLAHIIVKPLDLGDLKRYAKIQTLGKDSTENRDWKIQWKGNYGSSDKDHDINEAYTITPSPEDIGRKFTLIISVTGPEGKMSKYRYTIKRTDTVRRRCKPTSTRVPEQIVYHSPNRSKGSWDFNDGTFWLGTAIHLHKPSILDYVE